MNRQWIEPLHRGDDAEPEPLRASATSPGATAAEVIRALASHVGQSDHADHIDVPLGTECSLVGVDPAIGVIDPEAALPHGGPRRGQVVRIYCATGAVPGTVAPTMVAVRRGPDRGHRGAARRVPCGGPSTGLRPGAGRPGGVTTPPPPHPPSGPRRDRAARRKRHRPRRSTTAHLDAGGTGKPDPAGRQRAWSSWRPPDRRPMLPAPTSARRWAPWVPQPTQPRHRRTPSSHGRGHRAVAVDRSDPAAFAIVMMSGADSAVAWPGNMIWFFTPLLLASGATEYAWSARRTDRRLGPRGGRT